MQLGDIKIEALKLMFVDYGTEIEIDQLPYLLRDENYSSYLVNMNGAINRCFSDLEEKRVLPVKVITLEGGVSKGLFTRFNLDTITDFFDIDRVVYENDDEYNGDIGYKREGNILLVDRADSGNYTLVYRPKLKRVLSSTKDDTEIEIPDGIATHIPYFIKGDLYRDDEPNEASEARNWYEQAMATIKTNKHGKANSVETVYRGD